MTALYDLHNEDVLKKNTILKCLQENRNAKLKEIAFLLNVSERTVVRLLHEYNIPDLRIIKVRNAIAYLEGKGFTVIKRDPTKDAYSGDLV